MTDQVCWISSFFSGFGITISKILDYRVDQPSMLDFKFFLWFWKNYLKNNRISYPVVEFQRNTWKILEFQAARRGCSDVRTKLPVEISSRKKKKNTGYYILLFMAWVAVVVHLSNYTMHNTCLFIFWWKQTWNNQHTNNTELGPG